MNAWLIVINCQNDLKNSLRNSCEIRQNYLFDLESKTPLFFNDTSIADV